MLKILTVSALLAAAFLAGCSPKAQTSVASPDASQTLPGWVLVVPVEEDGRSVFVGGCSMALNAAEGVEAAGTDARLQIASAAGSLFTDIFNGSPKASGIATTSIDRLDFRETGLELFPDTMESGVLLERVYLRSCETGEVWETSNPPDVGTEGEVDAIDGAVCSVFVRATVDADAWERNLSETLREMRHGFQEQGRDNLVRLADWLDANLDRLLGGDDAHPEGAGARD